jgi:predicted nucleic acid-binding protein
MFLLDTNVISELRKGQRAHPQLLRWAAVTAAADLFTSVLVLAEIRRGIELKRRTDPTQAADLDHWFANARQRLGARVLPVDEPVAETWARLSVPDPLPVVDGLLAATAKVHGLVLVTRNVAQVARTGVAVLDPFLDPPTHPT